MGAPGGKKGIDATVFSQNFKLIMFVFIKNNKFRVKKFAVLSDSKDSKYPSDHLPVYVEISYKQYE